MKTSAARTPLDHQEKIKESRDERDQEYEGPGELLLSSRQPEHLRTRAPDTAGEMAPRIISLRPFDCRAAGKDARTATRSLTPQIAGLESCALRLRSVDSERGHSPWYPEEPRSRSRVDSAMAPLIWNGQSEKRQRAPNVGVIGAVDVESTKRALAGTIKPAGKKRTKTTGYNRLSQRLTRPVQSSLVTDYHC